MARRRADESVETEAVEAVQTIGLRAIKEYPITDPTDNNLKFPVNQVIQVHAITNYMQCQIDAGLVEVVEDVEATEAVE